MNPRTTHGSGFRNHLTCLSDGNPAEIVQSLLVQAQSSANRSLLSTVCANQVTPSWRSGLRIFSLRKGLKKKMNWNEQQWWERSASHPDSLMKLCWLLAERYRRFFAVQCLVITPPVQATSPALSRHNGLGEPMGEVFQFAALFKNSTMVGFSKTLSGNQAGGIKTHPHAQMQSAHFRGCHYCQTLRCSND